MMKFEPHFQIKCIGRGEGDERLILLVIDMYWDSKEASGLPLVSFGAYMGGEYGVIALKRWSRL